MIEKVSLRPADAPGLGSLICLMQTSEDVTLTAPSPSIMESQQGGVKEEHQHCSTRPKNRGRNMTWRLTHLHL